MGAGRKEQQEPSLPPTENMSWSELTPYVSIGFYLLSYCQVKMRFLLMPESHKALLWPDELQSISISYGSYVIKYVAS